MENGNLPFILLPPTRNLQNIPCIAFSLARMLNCYILHIILHLEEENGISFMFQ